MTRTKYPFNELSERLKKINSIVDKPVIVSYRKRCYGKYIVYIANIAFKFVGTNIFMSNLFVSNLNEVKQLQQTVAPWSVTEIRARKHRGKPYISFTLITTKSELERHKPVFSSSDPPAQAGGGDQNE